MKAQDLKNSILQLAIQGKLVPQDPNDESAEVLYAKIQAEKQKLIKEGKIKKDKPLPPIPDDEVPFSIPPSWKWVRLGEIVKYTMGKTPSRNDYEMWGECYNWVSISDLIDGKTIFTTKEKISQKSYNEVFRGNIIPAGTLLMSFKLTIGKVSILGFDGFHNEAIISIFPYIDTEKATTMYLFKLLPYLTFFSTEIKTAVKGITLNSDSLSKLLIPLPPLAEQKRIVAKIEELEPLIKQYEQAETELSTLNDTFPEQLKKSILQYAIQGKLVSQDLNDEPAEALYAKIQAEKQKLIKEGKIKKDKPLPPITDDEIPFPIPSNWKWVRLGDCFDVRDGTHDTPKYVGKGYPLITSKDFDNGQIRFDKCNYISENDHIKIQQRSKVDIGDILYSMIGGNIGNMVIVTTEKEFSIKNVALFKYYNRNLTSNNYLYYILKYVTETFKNKATGGAQPFISLSFIRYFPIPLPPLAKQHRIVAKVNELMQYCEKLKN